MKPYQKGTALVILSAIVFGLNPFFARSVYANGGNAWTLTFLSKAIGVPALFLMHRLSGSQSVPLDRTSLKKLLTCSLGCAAAPVLLYSSYPYISSGMATTLHFTYPAIVIISCSLFFRERLTVRQGFCCALCMAGILCFYTPGGDSGGLGIFLALSSGLAYAFYMVYLSKSGLQRIPSLQLALWLFLFTAVEVLAVSGMTGQLDFGLTASGWAMALLFSVLHACVATVAFQMGAKYIGAQSASLLSTFEPLTSVLVGVMLFQEPFSPRDAAGAGCILVSVVLLSCSHKRE